MIRDEVVCGEPLGDGVPVLPLRPEVEGALVGPTVDGVVAVKQRVEKVAVEILDLDLLEAVGDGVVGHVDRRVRQRFDDELVVPREPGSEPVVADTGPLVEPVDGVGVLPAGVLGGRIQPFDGALGGLLPVLVVVREEPRILIRDDDLAAGP